MQKISRSAVRDRIVDSAIGSLRIENLSPSEAVVNALRECVAGKRNTADVLAEVISRHVKVRR